MNKNPWKKYKNYWRTSIAIIIVLIVLYILLLFVAPNSLGNKYGCATILLALFFLLYNAVASLNFPCPNCAKPFFFKGTIIGSTKNCPHCGLPKWALPENKHAEIVPSPFWKTITNLIVSIILLSPIVITIVIDATSVPKIAVHKVLAYRDFNIIVVSRPQGIIGTDRELFAEIWCNGLETTNYRISKLDALDDYDDRIKDIAILPDAHQIRVEFDSPERSKSGIGVDLYEIK